MKKLISIFVLCSIYLMNLEGQFSSYQPGEKVNYIIHYGMINGGLASLELKRDSFSGKEVWHSVLEAKTTGVADVIFRVKDSYESFMNPLTELPVKSVRNINEGRYHRYNIVLFDHTTRKDSAILNSDLTGIHITQKGILDILSCFYWFRNHHLPNMANVKRGDMIELTTWFTDELYPIRMKYVGEEEVRTKAGKILCYKFNPVTEVGRLFKTEEDVSFWFSADKNYLPVKIRFDIFVGAFIVDMVNYDGLFYPLDIKNK
ncbi:MAG: DUF3108 domain-containing protein [Bacteroidales bacterium]